MTKLEMRSPVGVLTLVADEEALWAVLWPTEKPGRMRLGGTASEPRARARALAILRQAERQLAEYFSGARRSFDLPIRAQGTPFQLQVWKSLSGIPYGETISYAELARRVGAPKAVRAVGAANGRNPLPIVVPCHRVIGSSGKLVGFAGGLGIKTELLALEGSLTPARRSRSTSGSSRSLPPGAAAPPRAAASASRPRG